MQDIYEILCNSLDARSGIIQPKIEAADGESSVLFQISWHGGVNFYVVGWNHFGWYFAGRKGEQLSGIQGNYKKINDTVIAGMQRIIDEIESGKYNGKKTESEKIKDIVQQRQLVSYMNNTKWRELIDAINQIAGFREQLQIKYKTVFDEADPEFYWTVSGDEYFEHDNHAKIEWLKIRGGIPKTDNERRGRLLPPTPTEWLDGSDKIAEILQKYSIDYEYDEAENVFTIYGYRQA